MSVDETAKWSVKERIELAAGIARIEGHLEQVRESMRSILEYTRKTEDELDSIRLSHERVSSRVKMHEKVIATLLTAFGLLEAVFRLI